MPTKRYGNHRVVGIFACLGAWLLCFTILYYCLKYGVL